MFRKLRVLAAFFLVPIVVFSNPQSAAASATDTISVTFDSIAPDGTPIVGDPLTSTCQISMAINGTSSDAAISVGSGSNCSGSLDLTPGWCGAPEPECTSFVLEMFDASGASCGSGTAPGSTRGSHDGITNIHTNFASYAFPIGACDPVEVCLTISGPGMPGQTISDTECTTTALDPAEGDAPLDCSGANITRLQNGPAYYVGDNDNGRAERTLFGQIDASESDEPTNWGIYVLMANEAGVSGDLLRVPYPSPGVDTRLRYWNVTVPANSILPINKVFEVHNLFTKSTVISRMDSRRIVGYGLYLSEGGMSPDGRRFVPSTDPSSGRVGITKGEVCSFWWGDKIAEITDQTKTVDEPAGPVEQIGAPPVPVEPPVVPEPVAPVDDQPDDEIGLLDGLLAILRLILAGIKAIPGAILNGIKGLFVPEAGFMDARFTSIESKWDNTSPAKYADAVSDFSVGSASGCGGMPLNVTLPGGVALDQNIGAACSGPLANAAGIVRGALTALVVIGGLFACVRAVGSGLGWDPGVGRGAGS